MTKLADRTDIPVLEGWVNFTEAAELLGYSRAYMYKKAASPNGFRTLHRVGTKQSYLIATSEIEEILADAARSEEKKPEEPQAPEPRPLSLDEILSKI